MLLLALLSCVLPWLVWSGLVVYVPLKGTCKLWKVAGYWKVVRLLCKFKMEWNGLVGHWTFVGNCFLYNTFIIPSLASKQVFSGKRFICKRQNFINNECVLLFISLHPFFLSSKQIVSWPCQVDLVIDVSGSSSSSLYLPLKVSFFFNCVGIISGFNSNSVWPLPHHKPLIKLCLCVNIFTLGE